jgi:hypothetical protein
MSYHDIPPTLSDKIIFWFILFIFVVGTVDVFISSIRFIDYLFLLI